jgi:hypothetical protein
VTRESDKHASELFLTREYDLRMSVGEHACELELFWRGSMMLSMRVSYCNEKI